MSAELALASANETAAVYAGKIRRLLHITAESFIDIGVLLIEAKSRLKHGQFGTLFEDGNANRLPFSWNTANRFMALAQDDRILNCAHGHNLPASWRTCYELTTLSDEQFERGIEQGIIRPDMERADIKLLKGEADAEGNHRAMGTGENEWYTPQDHIERVRALLGAIDLDPASSAIAQERIRAGQYFTKSDDGLARAWLGRVWLNPPYAQPAIQQFAEKMVAEVTAGRVIEAVMLTHNYTDTAWFHIAESAASAICFTRGRIAFVSPEGEKAAPTQGQAFFYYGPRRDEFAQAFASVGFVR